MRSESRHPLADSLHTPIKTPRILAFSSSLRTGHGLQGCPALLSGGGAPRIKHGRHIILPKANTSLANYWLTLLQESGVQTPNFNYSSRIVSELLG